jgi:hypothetical protein
VERPIIFIRLCSKTLLSSLEFSYLCSRSMAPQRKQKQSKKPPTKPYAESKPTPSPTQLALQKSLAITPKTAGLLIRAGYTTYRDLRTASPNLVVSQLKALPLPAREAEWFRRALRRMVWLGTQDEPEEMARRTAHVSYWTMKGLVAKGVWCEGWDDLTGEEANGRFVEKGVLV